MTFTAQSIVHMIASVCFMLVSLAGCCVIIKNPGSKAIWWFVAPALLLTVANLFLMVRNYLTYVSLLASIQ